MSMRSVFYKPKKEGLAGEIGAGIAFVFACLAFLALVSLLACL